MGADAAFPTPLAPVRHPGRAAAWVLAALALHGALLAWIASRPSAGSPPLPPMVISLALISPASRVPAAPPPPRPKAAQAMPQRAVSQDRSPAAALATAAQTAAAPTAASPATAGPSNASSPAPLPLVAARFDADYLQNPAPAYPPLARRLGEQGRVVLRARISPSGQAEVLEIKTTSGSPRLDAAALEAVRRWRFLPAHQGDEAVSSWVVIPISFSLEN